MVGRARRRPLRLRVAAALAAAALALTGCAGPGAETSPPPASGVSIPGTAAGAETERIVGILNADGETTAADWTDRLADSFTAQVPVDEVVALVNQQLRPARPFTVTAYREEGAVAVATLAGRVGDPVDMQLALDEEGRIIGLRFVPVDDHEPAASIDEVATRLGALSSDVRVLVERRGADGTTTLLAERRDDAAPVASSAKLYVLLALAFAVNVDYVLPPGAEEPDPWSDELVVTAERKSLPSGVLQDRPDGTTVTVREAAQLMIEQSDNTATDLLIDYLGRDAVERAVATAGAADPSLLTPFVTTRELFELRWGDPARADRWVAGGEAERRAVLEEIAAAGPTVTVADAVASPGDARITGWQASTDDLAAVLALLDGYARSDDRFAEILGANPGVVVDGWDRVLFKGGSQPDAVSGAWLAAADDGTVLTVVVIATNDDPAALEAETAELFGLAADALRLGR